MYGVALKWPRDYYLGDLKSILDRDFPGWQPANQTEDFNGQTMYIVVDAIVFENPEDVTRFMIQCGADFNAEPATEFWFGIKPF